MKKYILLLLLLPYFSFGQDFYYKPISNLVATNDINKNLSLNANYGFKYTQFQAVLNINEKKFAFATYNFESSTYDYKTLFGDKMALDANNNGYCFGVGFRQKLERKNYNSLCYIGGIEFQNSITRNYQLNSNLYVEPNYSQKYIKIFAQFNLMKSKEKYDLGYTFRLAYMRTTEYQNNLNEPINSFVLENNFANKNVFFIESTYNYNFKILLNNKFVLTSQVGLSIPLNILEDKQEYSNEFISSSTSTSVYLLAPIFNIGIQYNIKTNKK